ncbi:Glycosyl hydrolase family 115 [Pustulibacterium marinum]|uniref:Glycosyl hydrolase family 115 n=1 Tax=Pustulibacterium marinum TaxID=1224947 RepID=A0A1I7FS00_9FLAO|nr:Glycosyl hydrolase family 115 [Pustulibacterium marinum]
MLTFSASAFQSGIEINSIYYDANGTSLDSISAHLLAEDIFKITSEKPKVFTSDKAISKNAILIGKIDSEFIQEQLSEEIPASFQQQKESYYQGWSKGKAHFIIAGTDARGTAFGVFDFSKLNGVSPWYWWADVPVEQKTKLDFPAESYFSKEPSVEFRGIFLNDEDWGLQPWAEKTFEPETGDIGPKTYAKIFELLLRLKANTIWPAMHPSTKAFFHYAGNLRMAEKYHIVLGSSHAEPMLRNNVDEWTKELGRFDYKSNRETVQNYWEERVAESKDIDAIFTVGMRGIHDSGMEGVTSTEEAANLLETVIADQRSMLEKHRGKSATEIPQAFTVYKEVLNLYDHGMQLPEDITLVWTDDNYAYIRRLGNEQERSRSGGAGVYYHASYWGRPHDYLWLSSTNPTLIWEEMHKAYQMNAKKIWILNVGDIKPAEYSMQFFMDMAYDMEKFDAPEKIEKHRNQFYKDIFGNDFGTEISAIRKEYYQLAWERKPEFMGWSQTEPTTGVKPTDYSPFDFGDEIQHRLNAYQSLAYKTDSIFKKLPADLKDSYFQLVHYPIKGAALMNEKQLNRDSAQKYAKQGRLSAKNYQQKSMNAYDSIQQLTEQYNQIISEGKWNGMMSMKPRNLPVFHKPEFTDSIQLIEKTPSFFIEGGNHNQLPNFYKGIDANFYMDIFLRYENEVSWKIKKLPKWLLVSKEQGQLSSLEEKIEERIFFSVDWSKVSEKEVNSGDFIFKLGNQKFKIHTQVKNYSLPKGSIIERNGLAIIAAENPDKVENTDKFYWEKIANLGYSGAVILAKSKEHKSLISSTIANHPSLSYEITTETVTDTAKLVITAVPTHPVTKEQQLKIGVQWDDNPIQVINFQTHGRSAAWKENVLKNLASKELSVQIKNKGKHTIKLYMIDEGVALDFIILNTENRNMPYSFIGETRTN